MKVSKRQQQRNKDIAKIKNSLPPFCTICGMQGSDLAHLVPKSTYPEYYTNPKNLVILCRNYHNKYDRDLRFRQKQVKLIERVKSFDECAANRYFNL